MSGGRRARPPLPQTKSHKLQIAGFTKLKMKTSINKFLIVLAAVAAIATPISSKAQNAVPPKFVTVTNNPGGVITNGLVTVFPSATKTTVNSQPITLYRGRGFAFLPWMAPTSSSTANVLCGFDVTADGTNWSTTAPLVATFALNGTLGVRGYANFIPDLCDNVKQARLAWVSNGAASTLNWTNGVASITP